MCFLLFLCPSNQSTCSATLLAGVTYPLPSEPLGWSVLGRGWLFSIPRGAEDSYCGRPSAWSRDGGHCAVLEGALNGEVKKEDSVSLKGPGALRASGLNASFLISIFSVSSYSAFCLVLIAPSLLSHQQILCLWLGGWEGSLISLKVLRDSPVKCTPVPDLSLPPTRGGWDN